MTICLYNKQLLENIKLVNNDEIVPVFSNGNQNYCIGTAKINSDLTAKIDFHEENGNVVAKVIDRIGKQHFLLCIEGRIPEDQNRNNFTKLEIISSYIILNPNSEAVPKNQIDEYVENVLFK